MGDVHFILRHAMTGAVFVLFAAISLSLTGGSLANVLPLRVDDEWSSAAAALSVIAFPMIGITIQGAYYCAFSIIAGTEWFGDEARKLVADKVRKAISDCESCADSRDIPIDWSKLRQCPDDAFFVWLYHDRATPQMIEWARRRRSYYYLGVNWALAAGAGIAAGWLVTFMQDQSQFRIPALVFFGSIWAAGAIWAADRMRRDADAMEEIWAASQIDPQFRECVGKLLPQPARQSALQFGEAEEPS
jgi:hypothetical protein